MQIRKSSIIGFWQCLLIYIMIISHGANIYDLNFPNIRYIVIAIGAGVILIKEKFKNNYMIHAAGILLFSGVLMVAHFQPYFIVVALRLVEPLIILYAAYTVDKERFFFRYLKVVLIFAVISLVCYYFQIVNPGVLVANLKPFPGWGNSPWYGTLFYTYRNMYAGIRNNGIFSEPGLFQMILNSAIALLVYFPRLFDIKGFKYGIALILLVATVLTTGSTTGYIGLAICLLGYLFKRDVKSDNRGLKRKITFFIVIAFSAFFIDYFLRNEASLLYTFVIDKFNDMGTVADASGTARTSVVSICQDLLGFNLIHWFMGCGYTVVSQAMSTSGLKTAGAFIVYYMAAAGLPATCYLVYPYLIKPFRTRGYIIECVVFAFLFFNTAIAQSRELYPALIMLPFAIEQYEFANNYSLENY